MSTEVQLRVAALKSGYNQEGLRYAAHWSGKTVYIIGTSHIKTGKTEISPDLVAALNVSELYVEYNILGLQEELVTYYDKRFSESGPLPKIASMVPEEFDGCLSYDGLDKMLIVAKQHWNAEIIGQNRNAKIFSLETAQQQCDGLLEMTQAVSSLPKVELRKLQLTVLNMIEAEASNDPIKGELAISDCFAILPKLPVMAERNQNITEKILQCKKPAIIAIGALHLYGPEGVLCLLQKRGVTISPVKEIIPMCTPQLSLTSFRPLKSVAFAKTSKSLDGEEKELSDTPGRRFYDEGDFVDPWVFEPWFLDETQNLTKKIDQSSYWNYD